MLLLLLFLLLELIVDTVQQSYDSSSSYTFQPPLILVPFTMSSSFCSAKLRSWKRPISWGKIALVVFSISTTTSSASSFSFYLHFHHFLSFRYPPLSFPYNHLFSLFPTTATITFLLLSSRSPPYSHNMPRGPTRFGFSSVSSTGSHILPNR